MDNERAPKSAPREPQTFDGTTSALVTPRRRRANLRTLEGTRREMARMYREAESGKRDAAEVSKLVFMLSQIARVLELTEIERRLIAMEERANGRYLPAPPGGA